MDKISFCFPHYNRLEFPTPEGILPLFKNCLSSLKYILDSFDVDYEICICSFDKDEDYSKLTKFVYSLYSKEKVIFTRSSNTFTIGEGKQLAYKNSTGNIIAFLDADMIFLKSNIIKRAVEVCHQEGAYFPICYSFFKEGHGIWRSAGFGNSFVSKHLMIQIEWLAKKEWGGEDEKFYSDISKNTSNIIRENCSGFYHQHHPPTLPNSNSAFK